MRPDSFFRNALIAAALPRPRSPARRAHRQRHPLASPRHRRCPAQKYPAHLQRLLVRPCHLLRALPRRPRHRSHHEQAFVITTLDVGEHPTDTNITTPPAPSSSAPCSVAAPPLSLPRHPRAHRPPHRRLPPPRPLGPAGNNIGYPAVPAEIDWFLHMLQQSAPTLTPQDTATIHAWLTAHGS